MQEYLIPFPLIPPGGGPGLYKGLVEYSSFQSSDLEAAKQFAKNQWSALCSLLVSTSTRITDTQQPETIRAAPQKNLRVWGVSLREVCRIDGSSIPQLVRQCVEAINLKGVHLCPIYIGPGSVHETVTSSEDLLSLRKSIPDTCELSSEDAV